MPHKIFIDLFDSESNFHSVIAGSSGSGKSLLKNKPVLLHYMRLSADLNNLLAAKLLGWSLGEECGYPIWQSGDGQPINYDFKGKSYQLTPDPLQLFAPKHHLRFCPISNPYHYDFWQLIEDALSKLGIRLLDLEKGVNVNHPSLSLGIHNDRIGYINDLPELKSLVNSDFVKAYAILKWLDEIKVKRDH